MLGHTYNPVHLMLSTLLLLMLSSCCQAGVVRVHCSERSPLAYTGCLDGVLRSWDIRTGQCVREWQGHFDHILDSCLSRYGLGMWLINTDGVRL